ncbi:MAG: tetratricopeptide repeat protein [Verrucomicrobiota bacterium]|nr:tetratricopeptide repeat protein [Limisphaera sp.]MDW8381008.1 tetratricopeptide repeat protein [Verrucomicrobiota bacterium]
MSEIPYPERHRITAALGWMELGRPDEAEQELEPLVKQADPHPDVLEVQWAILAAQQRWQEAVDVADRLIRCAPSRPSGWLHRAYALRRAEVGGLERAWEALLPAAAHFPRDVLVAYNLSCYACRMGRLDEARMWLRRAFDMGDPETVKRMALQDPDLQELHGELQDW